MIRLELTFHDAEVLREALEDFLSDLRMEISHTDSMDYREGLKAKKRVLRHVADTLAAGAELPR